MSLQSINFTLLLRNVFNSQSFEFSTKMTWFLTLHSWQHMAEVYLCLASALSVTAYINLTSVQWSNNDWHAEIMHNALCTHTHLSINMRCSLSIKVFHWQSSYKYHPYSHHNRQINQYNTVIQRGLKKKQFLLGVVFCFDNTALYLCTVNTNQLMHRQQYLMWSSFIHKQTSIYNHLLTESFHYSFSLQLFCISWYHFTCSS